MEIVQVNIPDISQLRTLGDDVTETSDTEMNGIIGFIAQNWVWFLIVAIFLSIVLGYLNDRQKEKTKDESQRIPINYPSFHNKKS